MEKDYLKYVNNLSPEWQEQFRQVLQHPIVYADPMDLTKMLNIPPGIGTLPGVAKTQALFYPE